MFYFYNNVYKMSISYVTINMKEFHDEMKKYVCKNDFFDFIYANGQ